MPVTLARIDQRLIHGITVNQWNSELKPKRFMVVDNDISQDDTVKASMRMSKPAGTGMSIINEEKAIHNFNNGNYDSQKVFLIVKEPETLIDLAKGGVTIPKVNLGIVFNENGRTEIDGHVALNQKELADLQTLEKMGIPVTLQYTPTDTEVKLSDAIKDIKVG